MVAPYNLTNMTDARTLLEMTKAVNDLSGQAFALVILLSLYLILFIIFKNYDTKAVLLVNSFIVTLVSSLLLAAGLISMTPVAVCLALLVLSLLLFLMWKE
jgi:hypothetical protein